jgi:hypothetical protein
MTATEQLAIWAAAPNDEVFVWMESPTNEEVFVNRGFGEPHQLGRMRAGDVLAAFERAPNASQHIARDVLSRFQNVADAGNKMRVDEIKGIPCVIVEGKSPISPHSPYRVLFSSVASFTS